MCKGIGGGLSQYKATSPHHVQRDWWGLVPTQINVPTPCAKGLVGGVFQHKSTSPHHVQSDWWGLVPIQSNVPTSCAKGLVGACLNTNQTPHTMCKGIGGGVSQHKSTSPHHVQRDWWGLVPTQINVPTPCAKRLVGACANTNQRPHTMCKGIGGGGGVATQINVPTPCAKRLVGACPNTNQRPHTVCKGLVGACPNTNQRPPTMCTAIGGGVSQHKSTSPHHVQRDWWGLVPIQINVPTPCVKGLVGAFPNTNQRPYTMCKAIGGGLSQYKSTSPHHVQRDW